MQQVLLFGSAIFCYLHSYRDWLHSKNVHNTWFTRFGHVWDAPQYEIHGMVVSFIAGSAFLYFALHQMRLNAFLARAGVSSRRRADELIKAGKIIVNGKKGALNTEVLDGDKVLIEGKPISAQRLRYILLYKPSGYLTTLRDPQGRRKVFDLLSISERVVPVGRLDYDTTGALLLTNDGELANKLMHPSFGVDKVYEATVKGQITDEKLKKIERGIQLDDGKTAPAKARKLAADKVELIIHEGRKHQVKKMLAAVELPVVKLHRISYDGIGLKDLKQGEWRDLAEEEVQLLKSPKMK